MALYHLSLEAEADLKSIFKKNCRRHGLDFADHYHGLLETQIHRIADNPYQYPDQSILRIGYRRCFAGDHAIWYKIISENEIDIIRVNPR